MAILSQFGSLGGLGGMGASFPVRTGAPNSTTVDYVPNAADWLADWQARYDAEAARAGEGASSGLPLGVPQVGQSLPSTPGWEQARVENARNPGWADQRNNNLRVDIGGRNVLVNADYWAASPTKYDGTGQAPLGGDRSLYRVQAQPQTQATEGYRPNFAALDAERERMMPLLENQNLQQKSYDSMTGWGQANGIMGAGYSTPGANQVNTSIGNPFAVNPIEGVDMGWTDAAGTAANGLGVYAPGTPGRKNTWGLW